MAALFLSALVTAALSAQSFEVATIKLADPEPGRFIKMQSAHRFFAKNHTAKTLICAAYNLPPAAVSGGPSWTDSEHFDIVAATPGDARPTLDQQMAMLRKLLADRFQLSFHREKKQLPVYTLTVAKTGSKLKPSAAPPDALPELINVVYTDHVGLPARAATIPQFASLLQRGVLERPVIDQTGLSGRYDFDLEWAPDETQFGGALRTTAGTGDSAKPGLYAAMQEQLGLRLQAGKGPVDTIVIDRLERPSAN